MTEHEEWKHRKSRAARRDEILAEPHRYKVCDQCESISRIEARACPICACYRFHESPGIVADTVRRAADHAFPETCACPPRIDKSHEEAMGKFL